MFLRFYLFVSAYSNTHEVHETFDLDHGTSTEPLENHENVLHNAAHPEQQDVYNYELDSHNLHEQLHDGSDFVIEDHVEHPATWNFMEDANKTAEEAGSTPPNTNPTAPATSRAQTASPSRAPSTMRSTFSPQFNTAGVGRGMGMGTGYPQPQRSSTGLACTNDSAKATLMANQLIGMLFRSSQMMSDIVNMFTIPNPAASRPTNPYSGMQGGMPFPNQGMPGMQPGFGRQGGGFGGMNGGSFGSSMTAMRQPSFGGGAMGGRGGMGMMGGGGHPRQR